MASVHRDPRLPRKCTYRQASTANDRCPPRLVLQPHFGLSRLLAFCGAGAGGCIRCWPRSRAGQPSSSGCWSGSAPVRPPGGPPPGRRVPAGLLGDVAPKNGWQLAEYARETSPDGCSGCSPPPAGMPMGCAMRCATTSWSTWATLVGCWWSMRPGSSRRATSRPGCNASIPAPPVASRTARSGSSSPMPVRRVGRWWTGSCTCPRSGLPTTLATPRRTCPPELASLPSPCSPSTCSRGRWTPGCRPGG